MNTLPARAPLRPEPRAEVAPAARRTGSPAGWAARLAQSPRQQAQRQAASAAFGALQLQGGLRRPGVIQRATVKTAGGEFTTADYRPQAVSGGVGGWVGVGANISLMFNPKSLLPAASQPIGLVQTVRQERSEVTQAEQYADDKTKLRRQLPDGTHIDQSSFASATGALLTDDEAKKTDGAVRQTNPVFHATNRAGQVANTLLGGTGANSHGRNYAPDTRAPAMLNDSPGRLLMAGETLVHSFEVTALTLAGPPQYLGSVAWGYRAANVDGTKAKTTTRMDPDPIALVSLGDPSMAFLGAATRWNNQDFGAAQPDPVRLPLPPAQSMELRTHWLAWATVAALLFRGGQRAGMVAAFKDKASFAKPGGWAFEQTRTLLSKGLPKPADDADVSLALRRDEALMTEAVLHFYDALPGGLAGTDWGDAPVAPQHASVMEEVD